MDTVKYILITNYGNDSIALLQWFIEKKIPNVTTVSVDTSWAAKGWLRRVSQAEAYARQYGIEVIRLTALQSFSQAVTERQQFPSKKFQWCASFLKGLVINQYLDDVDPECEAMLCFGKRRQGSRANRLLTETVAESEYYNDRSLYYPLLEKTIEQRDDLISRAGFERLNHRSKECDPCIHSDLDDLKQMHPDDVLKTKQLEQAIDQSMFEQTIEHHLALAKQQRAGDSVEGSLLQERFDMGCGMPWGCGE